MTYEDFKILFQKHLADGLVVVIGSGLSCAEGMPGMGQLADALSAQVKPKTPEEKPLWEAIKNDLHTLGIEAAFAENAPTPHLEDEIRRITIECVSSAEQKILAEVFRGSRELALTRLFKLLVKPASGLSVITTNYDRLVEVAAEEAGLGVDTMFCGSFAGQFNEKEARLSFCRDVKIFKGTTRYSYRERVNVSKPHGSLDWYQRGDGPVRHSGDLPGVDRLVIPPGQNKFRDGYDIPFDAHRERANRHIDSALRFLIIGYGFNDDHLETHLVKKIRSGTPSIVIARQLTPNARAVVAQSPNAIGIEADPSGTSATRVLGQGGINVFPGKEFWKLTDLLQEVFS